MDHVLSNTLDSHKSCHEKLAELLARRDIGSAIRYFESIRDTLDYDHDPEIGAILYVGAKAYYIAGDYPAALPAIRTAIHYTAGRRGESRELGECFIVLGNVLREMGNYDEAEKAYRDAESIHRRNDDITACGEALNRLAGVLFRRGDLDNSLKCLVDAIKCAKKTDDKRKLAYLFGNVGRIYTLLGKFDSAEEQIQLNITLSTGFKDEIELARAYLSLGYLYVQLERFEESQTSLDKALYFIKKNDMRKEEVIYLTYVGELMIKTGDLSSAEKMLNKAVIEGSDMAPDSLLALRPMRHLAELAARQKNCSKALSLIGKTLPKLQKLNFGAEVGALLRIQAICLDSSGRSTEAADLLRKSIEILEDQKNRFESAESLAAMGRIKGFDTARRMIFLYRAQELYNRCGVKARAQRLENEIADLGVERKPNPIKAVENNRRPDGFPTRNARMAEIIAQLHFLKRCELPILVSGETGTGKDHLARYFHSIARPDGPFVAINCAAVPDTLIESELFGYHRGAFTGAEHDRRGLFSAANEGMLLLDEIGELPLSLQAKLLSVIETRRLRPLGTADEVELDVLIVAATNRNLFDMVKNGLFRTDLYYRLSGVAVDLPPLRERKEDIPILLELFMRRNGLLGENEEPDHELIRQFVRYDWPGNIRQMENKVRHLAVLRMMAKEGSVVELSRGFFEDAASETADSLYEQVERFERRLIRDALAAANGNKSEAARALRIHESTFRSKMRRYSIPDTFIS